MVEQLKNNWSDFERALLNLDKLMSELKMPIARFLKSWNVLLPILYYIYYNPLGYQERKDAIFAYISRALLFNYFQSATTTKLQQMKNKIYDNNSDFDIDMLEQIQDLRVSDAKIEDILDSQKGSRTAADALYLLSLDSLNKTWKYEQDHLQPENRFRQYGPKTVTDELWLQWGLNRNKLPNLHLLVGFRNASKNDISLIDYYDAMNDEQKALFRATSLIPEDISLLEIQNFGAFYEARKHLLDKKLRVLLGF